MRPESIGTLKIDSSAAIYLPMPFSNSNFSDTSQLRKISNPAKIYGIDLVYTRYKEVDSFNQPKLNLHRFESLKKICPKVFFDTSIKWRVLEQREAKSKSSAEKCFHGFVVYLKIEASEESVRLEVESISKILSTYKETSVWVPEKIEWKVKRVKEETGKYLPRNKKKLKEGITYDNKSIWLREPQYIIRRDSTIKRKTDGYFKKTGSFDTTRFWSTDEYKFLTRRKWSTKQAVVVDVTGSMSPFSTQVMLWIKYNPDILKHGRFTFFNDGDNMPDLLKKTGKTGGIYYSSAHSFDSVYSVMTAAMIRGQGGDLPENNLEAVRETLKKWPDTDTVLMVADNDARVKDISLLSTIKKPVSVMVCGVKSKINADYIKIVQETGGVLFVLNNEVKNLKGLKAGSRITIGFHVFEYQKGGLVKIH